MYKKLITACMALAAFAAFAVMPASAMASNSPELTDPDGTTLAVGSTVVGTNVGNTLFLDTNGNTLLTCTTAKMTGHVVKNDGSNVEGTISTADFGGTGAQKAGEPEPECTGSFGNVTVTVKTPLCIRSTAAMATDEFQVEGSDCDGSGAKVTYTLESTTVGTCRYLTTGPVKGDFTTGAHDTLTVRDTQAGSGASKEEGGFFCPASGMLRMTFTLETENGTTVTIS
jgi:hypothetical protein